MNSEKRNTESPGDAEAKAFFRYKPMLAFLLKGCIDEFRDKRVPEIVEYINSEQPEKFRDQDSLISLEGEQNLQGGKVIFDVHFVTSLPKDGKKALVDVEAQSEARNIRFLMNRSLFYSSALVTSEKGHVFKKAEYDEMLPTYTIWVCVTSRKELENSILERQTVFRDRITGEIVNLNKRLGNENNILQLAESKEVFIFLGERERIQDKEKVENDLLTALDIVFRGGDYEEFTTVLNRNDVKLENSEFEGEVRTVISLVKAAGEVRYAEGRAEGREEMQAESREAMREKYLELFKSLTEELGLSQEAAVKFLKLPKEEEENLLEDLQAEEKQESVGGVAGYVEAHKQETQQSMQDEKEVER